MARFDVIASRAAFVNHPVGVDDIVVADVTPTTGVRVVIPDSPNPRGEVGIAVGSRGVVNYDIRNPLEFGGPVRAALAFGRSPGAPGNQCGLRGIGGRA